MFSLEDRYEDCNNISKKALCREILMETTTEELRQSGAVSAESIYEKIFKKRSSLNSKLKELGLDLFLLVDLLSENAENKEEKKAKETFDALKVLKMFYLVEKNRLQGNEPVNLTGFLKEPNFNNLEAHNERTRAYRNAYRRVYDGIRSQVENAERYEQVIERIHHQWNTLIKSVFCAIYRPSTQEPKYQDFRSTLERTAEELQKMGERMDILYSIKEKEALPRSVMSYTMLFLLRHNVIGRMQVACTTIGRSCVEYPEEETCIFKQLKCDPAELEMWGEVLIKWEKFEELRNLIKSKETWFSCEEKLGVLYLASPLAMEDRLWLCEVAWDEELLSNVFSAVKPVLKQSAKRHGLDYSEGVPLPVLEASVQTIYNIYCYNEPYLDCFYGNTHPGKSLKSALEKQKEKPLDTVALRDWEDRVMNRILFLMGRGDIVEPMRMLQHALMILEMEIFFYSSVEAALIIHNHWFPKVEHFIEESLQLSLSDDEFSLFPF